MDRSPLGELTLGDILEGSDALEVRPRTERPRRVGPSLLQQLLRPEPMFWGLFSAGGFVAALVLPASVAILGVALPAGWLPHEALSFERIVGLVDHPIVKLYLLAVVSLPLFHWAHRFRYTVHHQFGVHGLRRLVAVTCYGSAIAGTVLAAWILIGI